MKKIKLIMIIAVPIILIGLALANQRNDNVKESASLKGKVVTVYRSKSCGCCGNYIQYLRRAGLQVEEKLSDDMDAVRKQFGVTNDLASCHTTRVDNYTVEGHIPLEAIEKLLADKPNLTGIALPDMPAGSPGMPGRKAETFKIMGFSQTGSSTPYLSI